MENNIIDMELVDDLLDKFDFSNELLDDSIKLDNEGHIYSEKSKKFNGKFYISYLGLNPFTIIKEDPDVLEELVRHNFDKSRLKFFINNTKDFRDNTIKLLETKDDKPENIEYSKFQEIIGKLSNGIEVLEGLINLNDFSISDLGLNGSYPGNSIKFIESKSDVEEFTRELISENHNKYNTTMDINAITKILTSLYNIYLNNKLYSNKKSLMDDFSKYKRRNYEYTDEEMEIFKYLEFPTAIATNESIFKHDVNFNLSTENKNINKNHVRDLYNLLTDMVIIGDDKERLIGYYK